MPPLRLTQEEQGELVCEHLVISETLAGGVRLRVMMDECQRPAPIRPAFATGKFRFDPFRKFRRALERFAGKLA